MSASEITEDDFKQADKLYHAIYDKMGKNYMASILYVLCLIYVRQHKHHKYEESHKT